MIKIIVIYPKRLFGNIIAIASLIMFAYIPTSINGRIFDDSVAVIILWGVTLGFSFILLFNGRISKKAFYLAAGVFAYMFFVTLFVLQTQIDVRFSIARIAPVAIFLFISSITFRPCVSPKLMIFLLDFFCLSVIIWNIGILLNVEFIITYTINNYSQFYSFATLGSLMRLKPVMSFSVHTFSSFFYAMIFVLCHITVKSLRNNRLYLYMFFLLLFTLMLRSSSSFVFFVFMLFMIFMSFRGKVKKLAFLSTIVFASLFLVQTPLFEEYIQAFLSEYNGVIPRYLSGNSVFKDNIAILNESFIGIGFNIVQSRYEIAYTDSGYILYLTMGSIVLLVGIYIMLVNFIKNNVQLKYRGYVLIPILLLEFAIPVIIYVKFFPFIVFVVYYLRSLELPSENRNPR